MTETIKLSGDYGYERYRASGVELTIIDAAEASWIVANTGSKTNRYPVSVYDSSDVALIGGTISGTVSLDLDWTQAYVNSAAILMRGTDGALVQDWRITRAWDGIRVLGKDSDLFTIDGVWLSDIRDDAVENDMGVNGTISNSLFDGVFVGFSTTDENTDNQSSNVVTVDDVLLRMETFLYKGALTHFTPFKTSDKSPEMNVYDSVFAIERVDHRGLHYLEKAWEKTIDASGNYFLNLSDTPLPDNYPLPPNGFTILQGSEARAYWENARTEWIDEHTGGSGGVDNSVPESPPSAGGDVLVTSGLVAFYGSDGVILGAGSRVNGWSDSSGYGNHLTVEGDPTLVADATPTGQDAILFDGIGDLLVRNSGLNGLPEGNADRTMFLVVNYIDGEGVSSGLVYGDGAQNQAFGLATKHTDDALMVQGWGGRNDFDSNVDGPAQGWMVQSVVLDDGTFKHYLDGALIGSGKHSFATDAEEIVIGAEIAGLGESELEVGAALIYDQALTEAQRLEVEAYLQATYVDNAFAFA